MKRHSNNPRTITVALLLAALTVLVAAGTPLAGPVKPQYEPRINKALYDIERAEFLYLTEQYLEASILSEEIMQRGVINERIQPELEDAIADKALLLKWLSDLSLSYKGPESRHFRIASFEDMPRLLKVFEMLYSQGEYEIISSLTSEIRGAAAEYLKALALYKQGSYSGAAELIKGIGPSEKIYPYTRVMAAQIEVAKGNYDNAVRLLDEILTTLGDRRLADEINLKAGYILYKQKKYAAAERRFLASAASQGATKELRFEAGVARAWSLAEDKRYSEAIEAIDSLEPLTPYDREAQELMLLRAYCHLQLGDTHQARYLANETLGVIEELKAGYNRVYEERAVPKIYLLDIAALKAGGLEDERLYGEMIMDAIRHNVLINDATALKKASAYHSSFDKLERLYRNKEKEISLARNLLLQKMEGRKSNLKDIKARVDASRPLLTFVGSRVFEGETKELVYRVSGLDTSAILSRWEKHLNRELTDLEKRILDMVSLDGEEGIWYLENTVYCQFLYWMGIDTTKIGGYKSGELGILEKVVRDLEDFYSNGSIELDEILPRIEKAATERLKIDETVLARLTELERASAKAREKATEEKKRALGLIENIVVRRAGLMHYDLKPIEKSATKLISRIYAIESGNLQKPLK